MAETRNAKAFFGNLEGKRQLVVSRIMWEDNEQRNMI
jgi:hypothetical protein